jgi:hypothetical protein
LRCSICFPHVDTWFFIRNNTKGKKGIIAYNTLFFVGAIKRHVEYEHLGLLIAFVEEVAVVHIVLGSQIASAIGPCSKPKNVPKYSRCNFSSFLKQISLQEAK